MLGDRLLFFCFLDICSCLVLCWTLVEADLLGRYSCEMLTLCYGSRVFITALPVAIQLIRELSAIENMKLWKIRSRNLLLGKSTLPSCFYFAVIFDFMLRFPEVSCFSLNVNEHHTFRV